MINIVGSMKSRQVAFFGENAVDIVLYVSKICSFSQKILLLDLSSSESILTIVAPDGYMEEQNIRYSKYYPDKQQFNSYDLIIVYSDNIHSVPAELLRGEVYMFTSQRKNSFASMAKDIRYLKSDVDNLYIVCRGFYTAEDFIKKMYLSETPLAEIKEIFFINDNPNDQVVLWRMEYNSVFLYESLSKDLRNFLVFVLNRVNEMFGVHLVSYENRFKWVM